MTSFETISQTGQLTASGVAAAAAPPPPLARYAIRQALDQEFRKYVLLQSAEMRQARYTKAGNGSVFPPDLSSSSVVVGNDEIPAAQTVTATPTTSLKPKRDFFGRFITLQEQQQQQQGVRKEKDGETGTEMETKGGVNNRVKVGINQVWVSFNEGFSNAVRKPITIEELMRGFF